MFCYDDYHLVNLWKVVTGPGKKGKAKGNLIATFLKNNVKVF